MKSFLAIILLNIILLPAALATKNVCTITINSSAEQGVFQQTLPAQYKYTELIDYADKFNENETPWGWMNNACKKGVQCDILIISAHFGGTFFSHESRFSLPTDELEKMSCESACDGILKKPKEIFMFGCNTLAGKGKDSRTPQQYFDTLIRDGRSEQEARAGVAFLFSPIGSTYNDRMRRIFSETPRIYGFNTKAAIGETQAPFLKKYLTAAVKNGYYNEANFDKIDAKQNKLFIQTLTQLRSGATQVSGVNVQTSSSISSPLMTNSLDRLQTQPVCFFRSDKISDEQKLQWLDRKLNSTDSMTIIPEAQNYLTDLIEVSQKKLNTTESALLEKMQSNQKVQNQINSFMQFKDENFKHLQISLAQFSLFMNWSDANTYDQQMKKMVWGDLSVEMSASHKQQICDLDLPPMRNLNITNVPESRWTEIHFIQALYCARIQNENVHLKLWQTAIAASQVGNDKLIEAIGDTLRRSQAQSERFVQSLVLTIQEQTSSQLKQLAIQILGSILYTGRSSQQKNIIHVLAQNLIQTNKNIKNKSLYALCAIEKVNKDAIALLQQELQIANNNEQKALIEYSLEYIAKKP